MEIENKANSRVKPVLIEEELKESFLDYAMSVVVSRAIPDVRDGLKPVHRRILYTMHQAGFHYNRSYHKSARVVGDVLGKYHPHGDQALYGAMVGMAQPFSKRYPLLDGQGNWGSIDGDNAAAYRYTEVRMQKISQEILADLDKETVDFVPNFDESLMEPVILPSRVPVLLINGTSGIAVGMATSIPPHNLSEVIDGCLALLDDPALPDDQLYKLIPAPDFPTGGIICGRSGIVKAYNTGRGSLTLRGVVEVEETQKNNRLIIRELPYQVNKADLIVKIADNVKNKIIDGISNIRDESNRDGIRVVIDLKRGEAPNVVLNQLYKHTPLQSSVGMLMLALLDNRPLVFTLRQMINEFNHHRKVVITRRCHYELAKAKAREHILHGFIIALDNIDEVVALIKASESADVALEKLQTRFGLSIEQGKAILDMRLQRLTGLEQDKIRAELDAIKRLIGELEAILADKELLKEEVRKELVAIKETYGDKRKTRIEAAIDSIEEADLVPDEEVVVTLTRKGYIKRVALTTYDVQRRGGKGKMGMASLGDSDDMLQDIFIARSHDILLFFTNKGRVYSMPVYQIPEASRIAKGRAVVNLLALDQDEQVVKLLCTRDLNGHFLVMLTKNGVIKRTEAAAFESIRKSGIRAINLKDDDELVFCTVSSGADNIVVATAHGQGIRFPEEEIRAMGRTAAGVKGIKLRSGDFVVGMEVVGEDQEILFVTEHGYGKRVRVGDFRITHRGGYGVRTIPVDVRNGRVVGLATVDDQSHILLIDTQGKIIRLSPTEIRTMGRQAKGVRLIKLEDGRSLAGVAVFTSDGEEGEEPSDGAIEE